MRKRLIAPLVTLVVLAALTMLGARAGTYDVNRVFHCSHYLAALDRPAADVLIIGNSQAGAAIDSAYVSENIDAAGSVSVEKLTIVQAHVIVLRMLVEDYLEQRGAPKLVLFQPMVVRNGSWQQAAGRPIHPEVNLVTQPWDELVAAQQAAQQPPDASLVPTWMQKGYRTLPAVFTDLWTERVIATLSYFRLRGKVRWCRSDKMFQQSVLWPYGDLPSDDPEDLSGPASDAKRAEWSGLIASREPLSLDDPRRAFELDQHRQLLAMLEDAGSEVVFLGYPNFQSAAQDKRDFAAFGDALNGEVIDIRDLMSPAEREALPDMFRDQYHLDFAGAEIVSRRLAELVRAKQDP